MFKVTHMSKEGEYIRLPRPYWISARIIEACEETTRGYEIGTDKKGAYILDPSERERFEAFLSGNDDPTWALVDELRNHPTIGMYPKGMQEEFSLLSAGAKRPHSEEK